MPSKPFSLVITCLLAATVFSCNNSSGSKESMEKKENSENSEPAVQPQAETGTSSSTMSATETICYASSGLKYETQISISFAAGNTVSGKVSSRELGVQKWEITNFTGTREEQTLKISFEGTPPVIGDASEWTDKPWSIGELEENKKGNSLLRIPFNAKSYETNKWKVVNYVFDKTTCQ